MGNVTSPAFRGTYVVPYDELKKKDEKTLQAYGEESAKYIMEGGNIEQKDDGVHITVPFEKDQEYSGMLAKYGINAKQTK